MLSIYLLLVLYRCKRTTTLGVMSTLNLLIMSAEHKLKHRKADHTNNNQKQNHPKYEHCPPGEIRAPYWCGERVNVCLLARLARISCGVFCGGVFLELTSGTLQICTPVGLFRRYSRSDLRHRTATLATSGGRGCNFVRGTLPAPSRCSYERRHIVVSRTTY